MSTNVRRNRWWKASDMLDKARWPLIGSALGCALAGWRTLASVLAAAFIATILADIACAWLDYRANMARLRRGQ